MANEKDFCFPAVTIGIPFFNAALFLEEACNSVLNQTFEDFECLLVDDGSTDGSLQLAQKYSACDRRFRVISDGKNKGLVARLNQIAHEAQGRWIARMDADDVIDCDRIRKQIECSFSNPKLDLIACDIIMVNADGTPVGLRKHGNLAPPSPVDFLQYGGLMHATLLMSRQWLLDNPYDPDFERAEDRELWCRSFGRMKVKCLREPLYFYRTVGCIRTKSYLTSYSSERKVICRYGAAMVGRKKLYFLWIRSILKSIVLYLFAFLGIEQQVVNKGIAISEQERKFFSERFSQAVSSAKFKKILNEHA